MPAIVECVPNFSEGRRTEVIDAISRAIQGVEGVQILSVSSDASHNRTVVTMIGSPEAVSEAAFRSIAVACNRIDLDQHQGAHPRIGAADVIPLVPVRGITLEACAELARQLGKRVGEQLGQPVYLYQAAATRPDRVDLADVRRGEYEKWKTEVASNPDRKPDFGPAEPKKSGATVIGARPFLIAFNVCLDTDDLAVAQSIAKSIGCSGSGLRYVKALGLLVEGQVQVSMNLIDFEKTPIYRVVEMIRSEAARYGCLITHSELVGLIPEAALVQSAKWYLQLHDLEMEQILEYHLHKTEASLPALPGPVAFTPTPVQFLEAVAAGTASPGGGSVAALAGSLAAALGGMVARLTIGRKEFSEVEARMQTLAADLDARRAALAADVSRDAEAYQRVMDAFELPRDERELQSRQEATKAAMIVAGQIPLGVARTALQVLNLLEALARDANPNAVTDAGVGAHMARAAIEASALNVLVNGAALRDSETAEAWRAEVEILCAEANATLARVEALVRERADI